MGDLLERVWTDVIVSQDSVYAAVAAPRTLGDDPKNPVYIADVARRIHEQVASLVSAGTLNVNIDTSCPLADAALARAYSMAGHAEGKIVLLVDAAQAERR